MPYRSQRQIGVGGSLIEDKDDGEVLPEDREDREEPTELGGLLE
jgi:hypothetical protein